MDYAKSSKVSTINSSAGEDAMKQNQICIPVKLSGLMWTWINCLTVIISWKTVGFAALVVRFGPRVVIWYKYGDDD